MKSKNIQETLAKILEIDQASIDMEADIDALKGLKEKEMRKREREIDMRHMKEARKKAKEAYDRVIEEARSQEAEIFDEGDIMDRRMNRLYEKNAEALVEEAMKRLFGELYSKAKE